MFYVVPIARDTVLETMPDGMMVLDVRHRVVDFNTTVKRILGRGDSKMSGDTLVDVFLDDHPELLRFLQDFHETECEMCIGGETGPWYHVSKSALVDRRGYHLGRLIWFHDVTEQKEARERFINKQRAQAMLKERELLARELHDGIGQMMAAANLQIMSAEILLDRGDISGVKDCLESLEAVTQETKEIIREYLVGVSLAADNAAAPSSQGIAAAVKKYIRHFNQNYGIKTELILPSDPQSMAFDSAVETQLQPIVQEALINIRRHSRATAARVVFESFDHMIRVSVEDNGQGFDVTADPAGQGFGLRSMQGRAEVIGAHFDIISVPGEGTRVTIELPRQKEET